MLFNSIEFAIFLPIVFVLYWFVAQKSLRISNALLLVASYVFYGWWDWRFLSLIVFSSIVDYGVGVGLSKTNEINKRKALLFLSIGVNLGFLGFFKYFNFFAENFSQAFTLLGNPISVSSLNIILPVGISFYTFQTLSYSIDVYKKKLEPTRDIIAFFAFVSFFPQLVAGPIERATNLLPQFYKRRTFEYDKAVDGMRQILWGLFKKIVIADNCAEYANLVFNNSLDYSGSTLVVGALFFSFQIYGDFSGYSDIAIGTSKLFGFNLMRNFAFPYFSRDIAEFWRRWHISLSSWFRDYLYIPLGGSRGGTVSKVRNNFIIFIVSGFWHGANWTFIVWGSLNALYFLPLLLQKRNRQNLGIVAQGKLLPSFKELSAMIVTFSMTMFAWIFFRAESVSHAFNFITNMFSRSIFTIPNDVFGERGIETLVLIIIMVTIEWLQREKQHALEHLYLLGMRPLRWVLYGTLVVVLIVFSGVQQQFIYFQF
jgi:alginate O-acetyltransferase complex protein AlgI